MSYRDFDLDRARHDFGLNLDMLQNLFANVPGATVSPVLLHHIQQWSPLAFIINTEKARSEWVISPFLGELWERCHRQSSIQSGINFDVDPAAGLVGICDFLISRGPQMPSVTAPVVVVAEAKRDNPAEGYGQCVAGMVAAQRFNEREKNGIGAIYGISTSGNLWKFLRLEGKRLCIDVEEYSLPQADRILGILLHMVGPIVPSAAAA